MKTLLDEAFAPVTEGATACRRGLTGGFGQTDAVRGGLAELLAELDPLPAEGYGDLRELLVSTASGWTASAW